MYDYEEENEIFSREGGLFQIDTPYLSDIKKFKRDIEEEEEIEKINSEGKRSFDIVKLNEKRSDNEMSYEYEFGDSADNSSASEKLVDEIQEFYDDEKIEGLEKTLKVIPEKLREALKESFETLNEYKMELKGIPDLLAAVQLLGRLAVAGKAGTGPYPYPYPSGKEPYPKKVKKSMDWQEVQDMLFGGLIGPTDDGEIEKSSKENPFPSITRAIKIKKEAIEEAVDEMEQDGFNPYERID